MLNRLFWLACIVGFIAIVSLVGLIHYELGHQEPIAAPFMQESFTLPITDKDASEMAVFGPESEAVNG